MDDKNPSPPANHERVIDLNADLGESFGNWTMGDDAAMLAIVTSVNIACGFHAGDPLTIRRTIEQAAALNVVIGAHVAYPDLVGFGRRVMEIEPNALEADVLYQLSALDGMCRVAGTKVRYVKPHGALYHRVNSDPIQAKALAAAVYAFDKTLPLLGAQGPLAIEAAARGMTVVGEGFPDRAYQPDGSLMPRSEPGAVHTDPLAVAQQARDLARTQRFGSLCLHGDTPNASHHAVGVRSALIEAGYTLRPFVS
jgi:5-oxoprolinase (ATP-hydrolysing) subunit A